MRASRKHRVRKSVNHTKSWALPNDDADGYVDSFISFIAADVDRNGVIRSDYVLPDFDDLEDGDITDYANGGIARENDHWQRRYSSRGGSFRTTEGSAEFEDSIDWEYEGPSFIDDESSELYDLILEARSAIDDGDVEHLLGLLDEMLSLRSDLNMVELENWVELLPVAPLLNRIADNSTPLAEVERRVVVLINQLCVRLCEMIAQDSRTIAYIDWRRLEEVIAEAVKGLGFEVQLTPSSKDGGKDVIAECVLDGCRQKYFIEIKHWRSGKRVRTTPVFDFIQVNISSKTNGGLFLSSSGFGSDVHSQIGEICKQRVWLGDEAKIVSLCQMFVRKRQGLWKPTSPLPTVLYSETLTASAVNNAVNRSRAPRGF